MNSQFSLHLFLQHSLKKMRRSYTVTQKLHFMSLVQSLGSVGKVVEQHPFLHASLLYRWMKRQDEYKVMTATRQRTTRKIGCGRTPVLQQEAETTIADWIRVQRSNNISLSFATIRERCLEIHSSSTCRFSTGWFVGFKKRHGFSLRRCHSSKCDGWRR